MTCGHKAAIRQEGHAAEFGVLGRLHPRDDLKLIVVPEEDRVVETGGDDLGRIRNLLLMAGNHLTRLEHYDLKNGIYVTFHVMCLDTFLDLVGLHTKIGLDDQEACVLYNLDLVDPLLDQLFAEQLVLLVDVDHIYVPLLICCVKFLLLVVPAEACEDGFVRIVELVMRLTLSLSRLKPLQRLIVTDSEDEVFGDDEEYLDDTDSMDQILLELQAE